MSDISAKLKAITAYELILGLVQAATNPTFPLLTDGRSWQIGENNQWRFSVINNWLFNLGGSSKSFSSYKEYWKSLGLSWDEFREIYDCLFYLANGTLDMYNDVASDHGLPSVQPYAGGDFDHTGSLVMSPNSEIIGRFKKLAEFQKTSSRCEPKEAS